MQALNQDVALKKLIDEYRTRCLWFLEADYYPSTRDEALRVLAAIERHGDVAAFQRASEIRRWLSHDSSASSVAS
jgi:hypothetical protein